MFATSDKRNVKKKQYESFVEIILSYGSLTFVGPRDVAPPLNSALRVQLAALHRTPSATRNTCSGKTETYEHTRDSERNESAGRVIRFRFGTPIAGC